jgi:uncharacterized protein YdeI (YjbR/CyaY-like superfamily)
VGDYPGAQSADLIELYLETASQWRAWLAQNHDRSPGVWLVFYRKETGMPSIKYGEALDEALCYGWVDSLIRKLDDQRYARKLTPRKEVSKWSPLNKQRVEQLIQDGRMTEFGLAKVEAAKQNGCWERPDRPVIPTDVPIELAQLLEQNKAASAYFASLAPSHRRQYIGWIASAKRPETRQKRAQEAISLLESGEILGLR